MSEQEALSVLRDIKGKVGRNYKSKIRMGWETGNYGWLKPWEGDLQRIRNRFGPTWLVRARP